MNVTDEMVEAACMAFSEARAIYPDGEAETQITDWFDLDAQDAVDFGVLKEPKWDGYSDIRGMQHEWYVAAVIKEPMRAALKAVLTPTVEKVETPAQAPPPRTNMTGPQDISTAPKMTDVLVWWPIVQLDEDGEPTEEVVDGRWIISEDQGGYWIEPDVMNAIGDHLGDDFTYADKPSHWMPLPAPLFVAAEGQP